MHVSFLAAPAGYVFTLLVVVVLVKAAWLIFTVLGGRRARVCVVGIRLCMYAVVMV